MCRLCPAVATPEAKGQDESFTLYECERGNLQIFTCEESLCVSMCNTFNI